MSVKRHVRGGMDIRLKYSNPMYLDDVAGDFPDMPVILAHPSFPWQDEALAVASHKPNVYIDLSGWSPKYFPPNLVQYANTLLKDRVLFGSDYPAITPDRWLGDFARLSIKPDASIAGISTDYERAYRGPNRYLAAITLAHGAAALILGDRPLITGVWKNSRSEVIIWRISYAEEDDDIPSLLGSLTEQSFEAPLESIEFSFDSSNVVIFDSALPGDEAQSESVSFDIAPGRYQVTTHVVQPTPMTELLLHRFYPIT